MRADFGFLVATAAFLIAALTMFAAVKAASYAIWLAMPLVAAFALHLFALLRLQSLATRVAVGVLLTPAVLSLGAVTIANAAGLGAGDSFNRTEADACFKSGSYAALAGLPAGIVAADIDYGPYLLALTPHTVLAAPYHRLSAGIVAAHQIFSSPPDRAQEILARERVTYVLSCERSPRADGAASAAASLADRLRTGAIPGWLERVPVSGPFAVYRLR